jgi:hypothetical protein
VNTGSAQGMYSDGTVMGESTFTTVSATRSVGKAKTSLPLKSPRPWVCTRPFKKPTFMACSFRIMTAGRVV